MALKRLSVIIPLILLILLLGACKDAGSSGAQDGTILLSGKPNNGGIGYKSNKLELSVQMDYMVEFAYYNDNLYIYGTVLADGTESSKIYVVDSGGAYIREVSYSEIIGEKAVLSMDIDSDGCLWIMENSSESFLNSAGEPVGKSSSIQLIKFDQSGNAEKALPISSSWPPVNMIIVDEYIYICGSEKLIVLDMLGNVQFEINLPQAASVSKTGKGVAAGYTSVDGYSISFLDIEKKQFEGTIRFDINCKSFSGDGSIIYTDDGTRLYRYDINTGDTELALDWISLGITGSHKGLFALPDNGFLYCAFDGIYVLSAYESGANGKVALTLATMNVDSIRERVIQFNNSSDEYVIELVDYSVYNTPTNSMAGQLKLNTEIIAGHIPDILDLSGLPSNIYEGNSLLENLLPFIESDGEINNSDFIPNILSAMKTDDTLLNFIPLFTVLTITGDSSDIDGKDINNFKGLADVAQGSSVFGNSISRSQLIMYVLGSENSKFYDLATGDCYFNSSDFVEFLEFAKTLPDVEVPSKTPEDIASGTQRFYCAPLSSIASIQLVRQYFGGSITFVGLPSSTNNETVIMPYYNLGMSSASEHKEGVWEFFKSFLSDDFLKNHCENLFPIKSSMLEYSIQLEKQWHDSGGRLVYYIGNQEIETFITDETDIELCKALLNSVSGLFKYNASLFDIVMEEASAFFAGAKTAAEVSQIIQGRASIYLTEQR